MVKTLELKNNLAMLYKTFRFGCKKKEECNFNCWQECTSEVLLNEFVTWLIANEAFQLAARLVMEWDEDIIALCKDCSTLPECQSSNIEDCERSK